MSQEHSNPIAEPLRWPHRLALALAATVFPLIWVGGLVTTYDAGMAVYDWPSTFGHNMFLYPLSTWLAGPWNQFIEHGHRLLGAAAGLITIALLTTVLCSKASANLKIAAAGALVLIVAQGLLGGSRVLWDRRSFALIHGCVGPLFFAYCCGLALATSTWWNSNTNGSARCESLARSALAGFTLAYAQLILGAIVRHPADDGSPRVFQIAVTFHVVVALLLFGHAWGVSAKARALGGEQRGLNWMGYVLPALLATQIGLGMMSWLVKYGPPGGSQAWAFLPAIGEFTVTAKGFYSSMIVTGHVANGSLILATFAVITLSAYRLSGGANVVASQSPKHSAQGVTA